MVNNKTTMMEVMNTLHLIDFEERYGHSMADRKQRECLPAS